MQYLIRAEAVFESEKCSLPHNGCSHNVMLHVKVRQKLFVGERCVPTNSVHECNLCSKNCFSQSGIKCIVLNSLSSALQKTVFQEDCVLMNIVHLQTKCAHGSLQHTLFVHVGHSVRARTSFISTPCLLSAKCVSTNVFRLCTNFELH